MLQAGHSITKLTHLTTHDLYGVMSIPSNSVLVNPEGTLSTSTPWRTAMTNEKDTHVISPKRLKEFLDDSRRQLQRHWVTDAWMLKDSSLSNLSNQLQQPGFARSICPSIALHSAEMASSIVFAQVGGCRSRLFLFGISLAQVSLRAFTFFPNTSGMRLIGSRTDKNKLYWCH